MKVTGLRLFAGREFQFTLEQSELAYVLFKPENGGTLIGYGDGRQLLGVTQVVSWRVVPDGAE